MLPHPPHKRFLSRVVFYAGVVVVALILRLGAADPNAQSGPADAELVSPLDLTPAAAYYALPGSS